MILPPKPPFELSRSRASRDPLADEALARIAPLHSGNETAEDWARFDTWKAFDAAHGTAAAKAQTLWDKLGPALLEKPPAENSPHHRRRGGSWAAARCSF